MAFDLSTIKTSTQLPPRIVTYGVPGIGKTTFAADMPGAIFLPVEDGLGQLEVLSFPRPTSYDDVKSALDSLIHEDHDYKTLVVDGLDKLEILIWDHVCETVPHEKGHACERIEQYGYGKGYKHALTEWCHLLAGFDYLREQRGMMINLIAHSHIVKYDTPEADPYDRYQLQLHKHAVAAIERWSDVLLFVNFEVRVIPTSDKNSDKKRGVGKGERSLFTTERPAFVAKNRYSMDDKLPLSWDAVERFIVPKEEKKPAKKKTTKKATAKA